MGHPAGRGGVTLAATGPALPMWLVAPPCLILMLVLAGYVQALREAEVPASRRRIRTLGSVTMMLTLPLIVYLFSIATPGNARTFMLTWAMLLGLLAMLVVLAMLDVVNSTRIQRKARQEFRSELRGLEADVRRMIGEVGESKADGGAKLRLTGEDDESERER